MSRSPRDRALCPPWRGFSTLEDSGLSRPHPPSSQTLGSCISALERVGSTEDLGEDNHCVWQGIDAGVLSVSGLILFHILAVCPPSCWARRPALEAGLGESGQEWAALGGDHHVRDELRVGRGRPVVAEMGPHLCRACKDPVLQYSEGLDCWAGRLGPGCLQRSRDHIPWPAPAEEPGLHPMASSWHVCRSGQRILSLKVSAT